MLDTDHAWLLTRIEETTSDSKPASTVYAPVRYKFCWLKLFYM